MFVLYMVCVIDNSLKPMHTLHLSLSFFSCTLLLFFLSLLSALLSFSPSPCHSSLQHNTFQCVLAYSALSVTAGSGSESPEPRVLDPMSFVLFLYEDGGIQWSRGEGDSAQHALVGFSNGDDK